MEIEKEIELAREKLHSLYELRDKLFKDYILSLFKETKFKVKHIRGYEKNYVIDIFTDYENDSGFTFDGRYNSFYKFSGINSFRDDLKLSFEDCRIVYEVCKILGWYNNNKVEDH